MKLYEAVHLVKSGKAKGFRPSGDTMYEYIFENGKIQCVYLNTTQRSGNPISHNDMLYLIRSDGGTSSWVVRLS